MRATKRALKTQEKEQQNLKSILAGRQAIIDPYSNIRDLSSLISNPFANLQVATQAAEMQAAETDISLASTLDTLRETGAGAGGATALAQAAARSKMNIAANIEQQEARNAELRAQGESQAMQMRMAEAMRLQEADVFGQTFMFQAREQRDVADLSRTAAMIQQAGQQYYDMKAANKAMWAQLGSAAIKAAAFAGTGGGSGLASAFSGGGGAAGGASAMSSMGAISERSLKKNIKLIGKSNSGINIYLFEYIDKIFGEGTYQGAMVDEVPEYAIVNMGNHKGVDYSKIDIEFKRIK